jgi:histone-lysine N-methyltransferase SETMAR
MIKDKLKPAIRTKRRELLSKTVLLHHDSAQPHAAATIETIQKLNFKLFPHPPYSPDLASSDYHLFGSLKKALQGHRFGSDEVRQAVHTWLCDLPKTFSSDGIKKLIEHCKKCADKQGDYIEK